MSRSSVFGLVVSAAAVAAAVVAITIVWSWNPVSDTPKETSATAARPAHTRVTESPAPPPGPAAEDEEIGPVPRATIETLEREALDAIRELMKTLPGESDPLALMGMMQVMFGNTAEGVQWWQRCLEVNPRRPDVYDGMAEIAAAEGKYEKAVELWRKALQINSSFPGVHDKLALVLIDWGKLDEAIAVLEEALKISPDQRDLSHFLLGRTYLQLEEYEKAQEAYEAALAAKPDYRGAWYGLATVHARLGHNEQSRQCMEKFRTAAVTERDINTSRNRSYRDLASVHRLVAQAHTSVGLVYRAEGFRRRAEQHWRRAAKLDPKDIACRTELATYYRNGGRYEKALPICKRLVEIDPANAAFHAHLGILYSDLHRFDAALAEVQRAIDLEPESSKYRLIYQQIQEKR